MTDNISVLIVLLPLCSALPCLALTRIHRKLGIGVVMLACLGSFVLSCIQLGMVADGGTIHYPVGNYAVPYGIEFVTDSLNAVLLTAFSLIGFLTVLFAGNFANKKKPNLVAGVYAEIALLITGILGMTATGDVFNLYVFLEITSLSAYCLISLGGSRGVVSAFRYMLVGTIAATFYLLGIGILYGSTGTLNMSDMSMILNEKGHEGAMLVALCFLIPAFGIKMALFPFHGWQPSAYAHAEPGTRPLIAGVMAKNCHLLCIYVIAGSVFGDRIDRTFSIRGNYVVDRSVRRKKDTEESRMFSGASCRVFSRTVCGNEKTVLRDHERREAQDE